MSVIRRSGQRWKMAVLAAAFVPTVAVMFLGDHPGEFPMATPMAVVSAIAGFVFATRRIRCPGCGVRWLWLAASERDHRIWLTWFWNLESCPKCGWK